MTEKQTTGRKTAKRKSSEELAFSSRNADNFKLELKPIQKPIVNLHREFEMVILTGNAGNAKDFMQIYRAISGLINKEFEEVIFMRSILEATSSKLGYLKGDESSKLQPYLEVFQEHMKRMVKPHVYERIKNKVKFEYPGFSRGKTFGGHNGNVCVIVTEAQNLELRELILISTRMADGSKLYLNGDLRQSDIGNKTGLQDFINITKNIEGVKHVHLGKEYQMRGRLVTEIDEAYCEFLKEKSK